MIRKVMPAQVEALGDDEVVVTMSTDSIARDGHILLPAGGDLDNYRRNPIVLWNHDTDHPVARAEDIQVEGDKIVARVRFAPLGISHKADEIRGLVKSGIVSGVSVGFEPIDAEPLDPKKPRGGMRISNWELLETSFCAIPVDADAMVTARAMKRSGAEDWKCGASRDIPIDDSDDWDGSAAESSIFEWAGGDDFDPTKARKGFLAYNAAKPKERGSYKLPIAHVVDGKLRVPKGAIRAAASRLSQTDIPDETKTAAQAVIDHYEEKAGMADKDKGADRSIKAKHTRAINRASNLVIVKRGLYEVANLAYMLEQFGYAHACSEWEAEIEGDESPVPAMLGEALVKFGEAFIAMSKEEVTELLAGKDLELGDDVVVAEERAYVEGAKTPRARAWRQGIAMARAGKTLSSTNGKKLDEAQNHHERALKHHKALGEHHDAVAGHMDAITEQQEKATKAHGELGEALQTVKNEPEKATEHVARAIKAHKALGGAIGDMSSTTSDMKDRNQDVGDSHEAVGRCVRAAQRCVRGVVEGSSPGAEDGDSKDIQTSDGTKESTGSEGSRSIDYRRRQADILALSTH